VIRPTPPTAFILKVIEELELIVTLKLNIEKSALLIIAVPGTCPLANSKTNKNNMVIKNFTFIFYC
jgi:hypothetical protein